MLVFEQERKIIPVAVARDARRPQRLLACILAGVPRSF